MDALLEYIQTSPLAIWGLLALLILCGVGLPMPEDVILIAAGLVAAETGQSWITVSVLMYFGVLAGDSLIFAVGRHTAGAMKVRYSQFLLFDGLAALVSVPVFVWLGHFLWQKFGDDFDELKKALSSAHAYTIVFTVVLLVAIASVVWVNRHKLARTLRGQP